MIVPRGHPLAKVRALSLEELAGHPLITYHDGYTGRARIDRTFADAGLAADIVLTALDSDVIKTYVELGLGVGIIAEMAYIDGREGDLVLRPERTLFPVNTARIALRRGHYLRGYGYRFIEQCKADLDEATVRAALMPATADVE